MVCKVTESHYCIRPQIVSDIIQPTIMNQVGVCLLLGSSLAAIMPATAGGRVRMPHNNRT